MAHLQPTKLTYKNVCPPNYLKTLHKASFFFSILCFQMFKTGLIFEEAEVLCCIPSVTRYHSEKEKENTL